MHNFKLVKTSFVSKCKEREINILRIHVANVKF
jgi:hypothetical protein